MTEAEYKLFLRPHERALRQIKLDLNFFLEDVGSICVYSITSRLKTYKSALQKSRKLNIPIEQLNDIAGLRVVVATQTEVEVIANFFYRQEISKDVSILSDDKKQKEDGYRARHIIIETSGSYKRSAFPGRIETQIQTIFEHAFNFVSRAWVYKANYNFTPEWNEKFKNISDQLMHIEANISDLHDAVLDSSSRDGKDDPLSPFSLQRIVKSVFNENISLQDAVDSCRFAVDRGLETNSMFIAFLKAEAINQLRNRFLLLNSKKGAFFSQQVSEISKFDFWSIYGYHYDGSKEVLESLEKSDNDK